MVSNRPTAWATSALVPTPSVPATSTGWRYRPVSRANSPPKPPRPPSTSGRRVEATSGLIRSTARSPALDVDAGAGVGGRRRVAAVGIGGGGSGRIGPGHAWVPLAAPLSAGRLARTRTGTGTG